MYIFIGSQVWRLYVWYGFQKGKERAPKHFQLHGNVFTIMIFFYIDT